MSIMSTMSNLSFSAHGNILEDLTALLEGLQVPFATGHFGDKPSDSYVVIIPLADSYEHHADNMPQVDMQEVRLALYSKDNFYPMRDNICKALHNANFTITDRRYIGYEADTKYHHVAIDVQKHYKLAD